MSLPHIASLPLVLSFDILWLFLPAYFAFSLLMRTLSSINQPLNFIAMLKINSKSVNNKFPWPSRYNQEKQLLHFLLTYGKLAEEVLLVKFNDFHQKTSTSCINLQWQLDDMYLDGLETFGHTIWGLSGPPSPSGLWLSSWCCQLGQMPTSTHSGEWVGGEERWG